MPKISKIADMTFDDKMRATMEDTLSFLHHVEKLDDAPEKADPFCASYAVFDLLTLHMMRDGWSVEDLVDVLYDNEAIVARWDAEEAMDDQATHETSKVVQ